MDSKKIITLTIVSFFILITITVVYGRPSGEGRNGNNNNYNRGKGVASGSSEYVRYFGLPDKYAEERKHISAAIANSEGYNFDNLMSKVWNKSGENSGTSTDKRKCPFCSVQNNRSVDSKS
ncbi:uncharacterized protein LOC126842137 [Adelges cooleyi]|uniref:uncharacterized protein LOC126842137 n=1 Tax=Adelges cooleyi TaxID=133065 RepID=UPI0021809969|nr:uncharacterized protein LOC126842137 [Adelges cooleyi]